MNERANAHRNESKCSQLNTLVTAGGLVELPNYLTSKTRIAKPSAERRTGTSARPPKMAPAVNRQPGHRRPPRRAPCSESKGRASRSIS
eukprot:9257611-Pyramimonas_sp.AAC.1